MARYSAPSVAYPTGGSVWLSLVLIFMLLLGLLAAGLYSNHISHALGWQEVLIATVWILAAVCVGQFLHQRKPGCLAWDGLCWHWTTAVPAGGIEMAADQTGSISVRFDGQSCLLIRFHPIVEGGRAQWLWLEYAFAPELWHDVRCAVYSRGHEPVSNAL